MLRVSTVNLLLRAINTFPEAATPSKWFCLPFKERSILKEKQTAPLGSKFFPFRLNLF